MLKKDAQGLHVEVVAITDVEMLEANLGRKGEAFYDSVAKVIEPEILQACQAGPVGGGIRCAKVKRMTKADCLQLTSLDHTKPITRNTDVGVSSC